MVYAARLFSVELPKINFRSPEVLGQHIIDTAANTASVVRRKVTRTEAKQFLSVLPPSLRKHCYGIAKSSIECLPPHVHTDDGCVINIYVSTGGEETVFYSGEVTPLSDGADDLGNGYFLADPDTLKPEFRFVAQPGEVWLLNTKEPHAVCGASVGVREVVQLYISADVSSVLLEFQHVQEV